MSDKYYATFNADGSLSQRLIAGIHSIPKTAVPIDDDLWMRLTQEFDGVWVLGKDKVITKQPLPVIEPDYPTIERQWRDNEIERIKWIRERHRDEIELGGPTTITAPQFSELLAYLQALRGWPQSQGFPDESKRPVPPDWVADQDQ